MTCFFTTEDKAAVVSFSSTSSSSNAFLTPGVAFARYLLIGCWKNLIDTLSTPLTGRMAGSSKGLAFILGAEGAKEQNQKEKDSICVSLDGLRRAARLSCALGTAACGMLWRTHKTGWVAFLDGIWEREKQHPVPVLDRNLDCRTSYRAHLPYSIDISSQLYLSQPVVEIAWDWGGNAG